MLHQIDNFTAPELPYVQHLLDCIDESLKCEADSSSRRLCDKILVRIDEITKLLEATPSTGNNSKNDDKSPVSGKSVTISVVRKRPYQLVYWTERLYKLVSRRKLVLRNIQASTDHFAYHHQTRVRSLSLSLSLDSRTHNPAH